MAEELVRLNVDVLAAANSQSVRAAKEATGTIPIVMFEVGHPVDAGFVASLARPGGNVTGMSSQLSELEGKSVELSRNAEPIERLYRTLEAYFFKGQPRAFVGEDVREEDHLCRGEGDRGWRGRVTAVPSTGPLCGLCSGPVIREGPMDQDTAVSSALIKLLKAAQTGTATQSDFDARANLARKAEELASQWQSWVAKSVVFLARSFFLLDPTGASEVFGGMAKVLEMMQAGGVEALFLRGYGAAFRGEADAAINAFRAADAIRPNDPFIQFSLLMALHRYGSTHDTVQMLGIFFRNHGGHPLYELGQELFPEK